MRSESIGPLAVSAAVAWLILKFGPMQQPVLWLGMPRRNLLTYEPYRGLGPILELSSRPSATHYPGTESPRARNNLMRRFGNGKPGGGRVPGWPGPLEGRTTSAAAFPKLEDDSGGPFPQRRAAVGNLKKNPDDPY